MEPVYPEYDMDFDDDAMTGDYLDVAARLTTASIQNGFIQSDSSPEVSADNVMTFFEIVYRRIRDLVEEDDEYVDEMEENGESDLS